MPFRSHNIHMEQLFRSIVGHNRDEKVQYHTNYERYTFWKLPLSQIHNAYTPIHTFHEPTPRGSSSLEKTEVETKEEIEQETTTPRVGSPLEHLYIFRSRDHNHICWYHLETCTNWCMTTDSTSIYIQIHNTLVNMHTVKISGGALEDMLEEGPRGRHEQKQDANGVWDAIRLGECTTESTCMAGVLKQQVGTDRETDDVRERVAPYVDDQVGGSDDEQDESHGELQVTYKTMNLVSNPRKGKSHSYTEIRKKDGSTNKFRLTVNQIGELLSEEQTNHHSNESDPCTDSSPATTKIPSEKHNAKVSRNLQLPELDQCK